MEKKLENIKNYKKELAYAKLENYHLRKKAKENNLIKKMVRHELITPLNSINGMVQLLDEEVYESQEEKKEFCNIAYREKDKMLNMMSILVMDGTSREEIRKNYEKFSLEEIASNNAYTRNNNLMGEELELDLKYNKIHQQDIEIYSNKGVIENIWKTLFENTGNFAPKNTKIKQGIRFDENGNLEIIMENKHENNKVKRKFGGFGEGTGLKFVKNIVKKLNGKLEVLNKSLIDNKYHRYDKYGYILNEEEKNNEKNYETFAIKITIPKSEIYETKIKEKR